MDKKLQLGKSLNTWTFDAEMVHFSTAALNKTDHVQLAAFVIKPR